MRCLIVHGTKDEDVPIEISRENIRSRQDDPGQSTLVGIPDAGRN